MSAIKVLTDRVAELEVGLAGKVAEEVSKAEKRWETLRKTIEDGWRKERESWEAERERLRGVVREWEEASRRAHEEEEERELNERLSEDEFVDEEEDDVVSEEPDEAMLGIGNGWKENDVLDVESPGGLSTLLPGRSPKTRRRRPSNRTSLAVNAIKKVVNETGSATPKAELQSLADGGTLDLESRTQCRTGSRLKALGKKNELEKSLARNSSAMTFKAEKESSESGRDSGDTLRDSNKEGVGRGTANLRKRKAPSQPPGVNQLAVVGVIAVAVVAGALYLRRKD